LTTKNKIQGKLKDRVTVCMFFDTVQIMLVMFTGCLT
jgi:hypothetical protein